MPWYKCFVSGKNFSGELIDESGSAGFYTTCFVEAENPEDAEIKGFALLKKDPRLILRNPGAATEEAKIYFEEILEVSAQEVPKIQEGLVWYGKDKKTNGTRIFFAFYALCILIQLIDGYFTQLSVTTWYPTLNKSELTPPGAAFGIAWTILYFLMAVAATRIYLKRNTWRSRSLAWWLIQLILGLLWCIVFFGQRNIGLGLVVIVANWLAVVLSTYRFLRIDRLAGWMLLPLLLWLSFASYLNYFIQLHN